MLPLHGRLPRLRRCLRKKEIMENQTVYDHFIAWMKKAWIGLPDSEALLPTVKACYSEAEAALLTGVPFSPKGIEELANRKGMKPADLSAMTLTNGKNSKNDTLQNWMKIRRK
jgi:hypothetical protein